MVDALHRNIFGDRSRRAALGSSFGPNAASADIGDAVNVRLMGGGRVLRASVESIAAGIEDRDRSAGATLLANINPTFNGMPLTQRGPVRIAFDRPAERNDLVAGRTAAAEVLGSALRVDRHDMQDRPRSSPRSAGRLVPAALGRSSSCH
ncbi:MAG: hypothetical protein K2Z80_15365 [Xanthobacteraceae bacterium]|nr:hypothetical protein [Xanthobacteraceae bacterium]